MTGKPQFSLCCLIGVSVGMFAVSCAKRPGADQSSIHSTPKAVFDAYRDAQNDRNWRKCFECLTPRAQNLALFEIVFQSGLSGDKSISAALNKYIIDDGTLAADVKAKSERRHGGDSNDPPDTQLLADTLATRIIDKAGFFETGNNLLWADESLPPLGELQHITVDGNTAKGRATTVVTHFESSGGPSKKVETVVYQSFTFRFMNRQWLIDTP